MTTPESSAAPGSATSYAVLGLLSVRPWTTYELAKQVRRSLNWFWPRAERRLYDEPKRLVAEGYATATREHTGQRPRTVYAITEAGSDALRRWLDLPSAPRSAEFEAMLRVFFADAGSLEQLQATLAAIEDEAVSRLQELAAMAAQALGGDVQFPARLHLSALTLRLQVAQEQAVREWAGWAREQVGHWAATDDPGEWEPHAVLEQLLAGR